jgi:hypothetical protein
MIHTLFKGAVPRRVKPDGTNWEVVAGTSDTSTSSAIDTSGFNEVSILLALGAVTNTGVGTYKLQHSNDDAVADPYADIAGSAQALLTTTADSYKTIVTGIYQPQKRYIKVIFTRATANLVVDALYAILSKPIAAPVATDATIASCSPEFFSSPASGTA